MYVCDMVVSTATRPESVLQLACNLKPVILNRRVATHKCVARLPQVCRETLWRTLENTDNVHESRFHVLLIWLGGRNSVYLTKIFGQLNIMQGRKENILTSVDKLVALENKIVILRNRTKLGEFDMFPTMRIWSLSWLSIWHRSQKTSTTTLHRWTQKSMTRFIILL